MLCFELPTSPKSATTEIPTKPIRAAGIGSKIRPIITAKKIPKNLQASTVKPVGAGINQIIKATNTGISNFIFLLDINPPSNNIKEL